MVIYNYIFNCIYSLKKNYRYSFSVLLTKHTLIVEHYVTWIDESSCFLDYALSQMMNFFYFKLIKWCVFIKEKKNDYNNNNKKEI